MIIDFILHLNEHLATFIQTYGHLAYLVLFLVIFCETGLVLTPFLPGDSLLFALGALAANHLVPLNDIIFLLLIAAFSGDNLNYCLGRWVGFAILSRFQGRWIKKKHLDRTHAFYEKHGPMTIIFARFVPIVRTFAPFVAGIGAMTYWRFLVVSFLAAVLWIGGLIYLGFFFGNLPLVKNHFSEAILAVILISLLPMVLGYFRQRAK